MVELQENLKSFEKNGIRVCAISYDPVDALGKFTEKFGITYPLLSDVDSAVIRRFGVLNTHIPEGHPWYGVPFPGTFMVDERGVVIDRSFYANHAVRDSVARMLYESFRVTDAERGLVQTVEADSVTATAYLSSGTVRPGQVLTFTVEVKVKEGRHIQARPLPEGYIPTTLTFQEVEGVHFERWAIPSRSRTISKPWGRRSTSTMAGSSSRPRCAAAGRRRLRCGRAWSIRRATTGSASSRSELTLRFHSPIWTMFGVERP